MDILIKEFHTQYKKAVHTLITGIQQEEFALPITLDAQPDLKDILRHYRQKAGNFWVALHEGSVVGTVALLDMGDARFALKKLFVNERYRGTGVADKLLETVFDWAQKENAETIYLGTASAFVSAHRFYEKWGFIEISKEMVPSDFPLLSIDSKFYKYQLCTSAT